MDDQSNVMTNLALVLVPLRDKKPIRPASDPINASFRKGGLPYLKLGYRNVEKVDDNLEQNEANRIRSTFGRGELLSCLLESCGCSQTTQKKMCANCRNVVKWAQEFMSNDFLRADCSHDLTELWVKKDASYPRSLILLGADREGCTDYRPIDSIVTRSRNVDGDAWLGPVELNKFARLKLCPPHKKGDALEFALWKYPQGIEENDPDRFPPDIVHEDIDADKTSRSKDPKQDYQYIEQPTNELSHYQSARDGFQRSNHGQNENAATKVDTQGSDKQTLKSQGGGHDYRERNGKETKDTSENHLKRSCALQKDEMRAETDFGGNKDVGLQQSKTHTIAKEQSPTSFRVYFVREGMDMIDELIGSDGVGLKQHVIQRNATVLDHFDKTKPPYPTHIVVSDNGIKPEKLASALGFDHVEDLEDFVDNHCIVCVHRKWASKGNAFSKPPFRSPTLQERYIGLRPKGKREGTSEQEFRRVRSRNEDPLPGKHNQKLSDHFKKLSKLYQTAPVHDTDDWRAYSFSLTAGRLLFLDFEVRDDPYVLDRVSKTKGFGSTTMSIICDFLKTGTSGRLHELENDENRVVMRRMMNIWGIGRAKATELVRAGYRSIHEVKSAVEAGTLLVDRSQYIGLLCYDDIMEEMSRSEVEAIFAIVEDVFKEDYPRVEMQINGSYRRGKETCGDIDILVTHASYYDTIPPNAVGVVADKLLARGIIEHHLTYISGMNPELFNRSIPLDVRSKVIEHRGSSRGKQKSEKSSSTTYFGVIRSPVVLGRRRRLDIKFYPYRERIFASIYFTGNGYFNRAMRLWSQQKMGWTLNDHGLFKENTEVSILENPVDEKEVFDKLGLVWKEVNERDSFAAVQAKEGNENAIQLRELSRSALREEDMNHQWIE